MAMAIHSGMSADIEESIPHLESTDAKGEDVYGVIIFTGYK